MARGVNSWTGSGNVGGEIVFGETSSGDALCSFQVACEDRRSGVTWVRVNVFNPGLVKICKERLKKSIYVVVKGELMNRSDNPFMLEVRGEELVFLPGPPGAGGRNEQRREEAEDGEDGRGNRD